MVGSCLLCAARRSFAETLWETSAGRAVGSRERAERRAGLPPPPAVGGGRRLRRFRATPTDDNRGGAGAPVPVRVPAGHEGISRRPDSCGWARLDRLITALPPSPVDERSVCGAPLQYGRSFSFCQTGLTCRFRVNLLNRTDRSPPVRRPAGRWAVGRAGYAGCSGCATRPQRCPIGPSGPRDAERPHEERRDCARTGSVGGGRARPDAGVAAEADPPLEAPTASQGARAAAQDVQPPRRGSGRQGCGGSPRLTTAGRVALSATAGEALRPGRPVPHAEALNSRPMQQPSRADALPTSAPGRDSTRPRRVLGAPVTLSA